MRQFGQYRAQISWIATGGTCKAGPGQQRSTHSVAGPAAGGVALEELVGSVIVLLKPIEVLVQAMQQVALLEMDDRHIACPSMACNNNCLVVSQPRQAQQGSVNSTSVNHTRIDNQSQDDTN